MAEMSRKDYYLVDPREIVIDEGWNPRKHFEPDHILQLKESIRINGVQNPLHIRMVGDVPHLVDGECRLRACLELCAEGIDLKVPVFKVRKGASEIERMYTALITNTGQQLTPLEEAGAIRRLLGWGHTEQEIAQRLGKSITTIKNRLELLDASPDVVAAVEDNQVSINDALKIVRASQGSIEHQNRTLEAVKIQKQEKKTRRRTAAPEGEQTQTVAPKRTYVVCERHEKGARIYLYSATSSDEVRAQFLGEDNHITVHAITGKNYIGDIVDEIFFPV